MTEDIKKVNQSDHIDRISDLPINVIDGILQHLPIRDIAKTSVLSRKWRYMWVSIPHLEFGDEFFDYCYNRDIEHQIPNIISDILLGHNGPVSKFTLKVPCYFTYRITSLYKWILFLSKNGIKVLVLVNHNQADSIPSHLFSCQSLTSLKLDQFNKLSLPHNFCGFKNLLSLNLIHIRIDSNSLERLISGCPVLVKLIISRCIGFDCINVSAPSLKVLRIYNEGETKSIFFKNATNLTDLALIMGRHINTDRGSGADFINGLPKIERLHLREGYIQFLSSGSNHLTLRNSTNSLKCLELVGLDFNRSGELLFIVSLLKSSSILRELVIKSYTVPVVPPSDYLKALYLNSYCLTHLEKVSITVGTAYEHAVCLIRFLLASSPSLETLTFKVGFGLKQSDAPILLNISRDLLQFGRASQRAEVKFVYHGLT
ncbi:hypothetical protein Lal_00029386 [Lupinus albus]|uniref:Putative F-box domain, leucine-rich repeat domain, L domain-containing protein n=1 Tax=Lupinus albus TaxID=3870 RepID=A0A6A5NH87_LUPAL|nr:putative F-box domain, leucine-rich repeat domain, L domain-containing protein [Lupinus albus]KAF1885497.1 hypothetical protein Lal_00029386 [Lupinus albus]